MRKRFSTFIIVLLFTLAASGEQKTIDQLKAEAEHAEPGHQGQLYAEIAARLVAVADQQFTDSESIKGHATVDEIQQYASKAHDLALQTRKRMKEVEKHLRLCRHSLENMRRTLAAEDRPTVEAVEKQVEQYTEDVLEAMFAPPNKEKN